MTDKLEAWLKQRAISDTEYMLFKINNMKLKFSVGPWGFCTSETEINSTLATF